MSFVLSNHYLIKAIEGLEKDPSSQKAVTDFIFELKVSNLLIPGMEEGDELVYETLVSEDDELVYLPLFTSEEEFYKHYDSESEYEPIDNEFEIYAGIAADENIDGIIIDVESLCFEVPPAVLEIAETDFEISFDEIETRPLEQIKEAYDNADNADLAAFIRDDENADNFEGLMAELSYSTPLNIVVSQEALDGFADDGVIKADDVGGFTLCTLEDEGSRYAIMFTDKDAISKAIQDDELNYYAQITRVSELFEFVLRNDMDGVIINPFSDEFTIPRSVLLSQASGIELIAEDASFRNCLEYAFLL